MDLQDDVGCPAPVVLISTTVTIGLKVDCLLATLDAPKKTAKDSRATQRGYKCKFVYLSLHELALTTLLAANALEFGCLCIYWPACANHSRECSVSSR